MKVVQKTLLTLGIMSLLTSLSAMAADQPASAANAPQTQTAEHADSADLIPQNFRVIRSTPLWDKNTVPKKLLTHHSTKKGVYAQVSVMRGALKYIGFKSETDSTPVVEVIIPAGQFGISPPQHWHRVELLTDDTYFYINFFADPKQALQGTGLHEVVDTPEK